MIDKPSINPGRFMPYNSFPQWAGLLFPSLQRAGLLFPSPQWAELLFPFPQRAGLLFPSPQWAELLFPSPSGGRVRVGGEQGPIKATSILPPS